MNRRESLQQLAGGLFAVSAVSTIGDVPVKLEVADLPEDNRGELFVLTFPGAISNETADRIKAYWEQALADTPFKNSKLLVIGDGGKLERVPPRW